MPLAEAETLAGSPPKNRASSRSVRKTSFLPLDEEADREQLRQLAVTCQPFTPQFGIEEHLPAECLLLDVTGCTHLFGGDQQTAARLAADFRQRGYGTCVGLAPTIGAAWATAHCLAQSTPAVVLPSQLPAALLPLPVRSLRLTPDILAVLRELGLRTIGQVRELPRASIPSRFGPLLLKRLDQAFGDEPEIFAREKPRERLIAVWEGEFPIQDRPSLHLVSHRLLDQLLQRLKLRREGIRQLRCELRDPRGRAREFLVGFTAPMQQLQHTFEMLCLQWEQVELPEDIGFVQLEAAATGSLQGAARDLFGNELGTGPRDVTMLLDRLSNRLGAHAVVRARLLPESQPELAIRLEPWAGPESKPAAGETPTLLALLPRPTCLFSPPEAIDVAIAEPAGDPISFRWDHREHRVIRSWPERIETGWWREQLASRDYFRVEVETGHHFWIFHRLDQKSWFIHGAFD